MNLLAHPLVQSAVLPAAIAALALAIGRWRAGHGLVAAAACLGVLACLLTATGMAPWPPLSGLHRLAWLLLLGCVLAPAFELRPLRPRAGAALRGAFVAAGLAWLVWPKLASLSAGGMLGVAAGLAAAVLVSARLGRCDGRASASAMLGVGALGLCAVALVGSSLVLAQLCGALAVVAGVLFVRSLFRGDAARAPGDAPGPTPGPAPAIDFALASGVGWGGVCLALLAALVLLLTSVPGWSLALLPLVFVADLPLLGREAGTWRPLAVAALALVPAALMVAAAIALMQLGGGADDAYYRG